MASLRSETGYDYSSYYQIFNQVKFGGASFFELYKQLAYEPGYFALMYLCRGLSFEVFVFIVSAICVFPKVYFIYYLDTNKYLMLFCYYCSVFLSFDMGIIRQGIAFSIILLSVRYIKERNVVKFIIIVFFASLFHTTSIIFLAAYFFGKREIKDINFLIGIIASYTFSIAVNQGVVNDVMSIIAEQIPFIGDKIVDLIHFYNVAPQYAGQGLSSTGVINTTLIKRSVVMLIFMYMRRYGQYKNNSDRNISVFSISLNCYFLSLLFTGLFSSNGIIASRGTYALYMFQIPCFGLAVGTDKSEYNYHILMVILCIALFYSTFNGLVNDPIEAYLPYKTIFQ